MKRELKFTGDQTQNYFVWLLKIACFCIFAGRAWQHMVWDAPFRALLWDQELMQSFIENVTGLSWEEYTTSRRADFIIQSMIRITGVFYLACAFISLYAHARTRWAGPFLITGAGFLCILAFLNCKEKFFQAGEMMEHAVQIAAPVLLYLVLFTKTKNSTLMMIAKIAVALTFVGHGLYAVNYYPQPGPFIDMLINVCHFEEERAKALLSMLGMFDFLFSLLIFIPHLSASALIYCAVWGLLTALARLVAGFDHRFAASTLNQYTFETVFRLANFLLPLWIFYMQEHGKAYYRALFKQKLHRHSGII